VEWSILIRYLYSGTIQHLLQEVTAKGNPWHYTLWLIISW
jgi:hypothetical protein